MPRATIQNATALTVRRAALLLTLWAIPATTRGQIYVAQGPSATTINGHTVEIPGMVREFTNSGALVNASLVSSPQPVSVAVSGGNLFVTDSYDNTIGEYNSITGATVNASLVTGLFGLYEGPFPTGGDLTAFGGNLFVVNGGNGTVGEYNATTGAAVQATLINSFSSFPQGIAVVPEPSTWALLTTGAAALLVFLRRRRKEAASTTIRTDAKLARPLPSLVALLLSAIAIWAMPTTAGEIFITTQSGGTIGEYTTSGATVNAPLVSGFRSPFGIAVSGENFFVTYGSAVGEYSTSGATVQDPFIAGLSQPWGIAVSGSNLFVANSISGTIGEYNATTGATVNASLVSGLGFPAFIAVSGDNLFVVDRGTDTIGEYNATTGATVNASLVSGLGGNPFSITVVPEPSTWALVATGASALLVVRRQKSKRAATTKTTKTHTTPKPGPLSHALITVPLGATACAWASLGSMLVVWAIAGQAKPADYSFTEINVPGAAATDANGVNSLGQAVGDYYDAQNIEHGFFFDGGNYTPFNFPTATQTSVNGSNAAGDFVGSYVFFNPFGNTTTQHGYVVSNGNSSNVDPLGSTRSQATSINDNGQIVGSIQVNGVTEGFYGSGGNYHAIIPSGSMTTVAQGENNAGQVVGDFYDAGGNIHGFLFSGGISSQLDFPGSNFTVAEGINDAGHIVGLYSIDGGATVHGFIDIAGNYTTFDVPNSQPGSTELFAINNKGQIVGDYALSGSGNTVGFLATPPPLPGDVNFDGTVNGLDISDVASHWLQAGSGVTGDANGDRIVNGLDIAMISSNWLSTSGGGMGNGAAVPEPSTFILVALGGLALLRCRNRPGSPGHMCERCPRPAGEIRADMIASGR